MPTIDTGTATSGMIEARQVCRNRITTSTTSAIASNSVLDHRLDRGAHELRRVVDDLVVHALGHGLLDLGHGAAHVVRDLQRVRARRREDADRHRRLVVEQRAQRVLGGAELDARDVAQARDRAARLALDDDVAELLLGLQAALRVDRQLEVDAVRAGRAADHAGRGLHVLAAGWRAPRRSPTGRARRPCADRATRASSSRRCPTSAPGPRPRCAPGGP